MPFEGAFSPVHILVVAVVALLVLGPDKLPDAARTVGRAVQEVRKVRLELEGHIRDITHEVTTSADLPGHEVAGQRPAETATRPEPPDVSDTP